jgi:hypothetical protein
VETYRLKFGTRYALVRSAMKRRLEKREMSGLSLIEVIALIAIFLIVSASIQVVSDSRGQRNHRNPRSVTTNQLGRDFRAPNDVIHTYAPRR